MAYTTDLNAELVSKQASKNTKMLFEYLKSIYGKKHLAGQQYLQGEEVEDLVYYHLTGKLPAVRGYDFMGVSSLFQRLIVLLQDDKLRSQDLFRSVQGCNRRHCGI